MSSPKLNFKEETSAKKTRSPPKKARVEQSTPKKRFFPESKVFSRYSDQILILTDFSPYSENREINVSFLGWTMPFLFSGIFCSIFLLIEALSISIVFFFSKYKLSLVGNTPTNKNIAITRSPIFSKSSLQFFPFSTTSPYITMPHQKNTAVKIPALPKAQTDIIKLKVAGKYTIFI